MLVERHAELLRALTHFIAILKGDAKYEPPVDQLQVMDVMAAIYKSAEEGREIRL